MTTFPTTQRSLVEALRSSDAPTRERAVELAARVYRAPVMAVVSHRWSLQPADAEDLTHDFLLQAFDKEWFARYDATRGRFRTFVRTCLFAFASARFTAEHRLKRGGAAEHLAVDGLAIAAPDDELDALFDREWARSVLTAAVDALHAECLAANRESTFAVFKAHDIDGAESDVKRSYHEIAQRFAIPVTQVSNFLNWARRRFRVHVLETLRALTANDAEFRNEARALLGIDIGVDMGVDTRNASGVPIP